MQATDAATAFVAASQNRVWQAAHGETDDLERALRRTKEAC